MSLSSALIRGIAGWRFAIWSKTDWLSLTIQTFLGDSCLDNLQRLSDRLYFGLKGLAPCVGRYGI